MLDFDFDWTAGSILAELAVAQSILVVGAVGAPEALGREELSDGRLEAESAEHPAETQIHSAEVSEPDAVDGQAVVGVSDHPEDISATARNSLEAWEQEVLAGDIDWPELASTPIIDSVMDYLEVLEAELEPVEAWPSVVEAAVVGTAAAGQRELECAAAAAAAEQAGT